MPVQQRVVIWITKAITQKTLGKKTESCPRVFFARLPPKQEIKSHS
jgi:hypothetical protein